MDTLNKIKQLLKANNLNQKDLTDYLCISKNAFTNWSNGSNSSYIKHLPQIAEFFNVSIDYLAGRTEKQGDLTDGVYRGGKEPVAIPNTNKNPEIQQIIHKLTTVEIPDDVIEFINNALDAYRK